MNVACNECQSVYRVDPAKVTRENLRARCSVCGAIIAVGASVRWADAFSDVPSPSAPILDAPLSGSPAVPRETAVAPVHGQAPNDRRTPAGQQPVVPTQPPLPSAAELTASFRAPQASTPVAPDSTAAVAKASPPAAPAPESSVAPPRDAPLSRPSQEQATEPTLSGAQRREAPPTPIEHPPAAAPGASSSYPAPRRLTPLGGGAGGTASPRPASPAFGAPLPPAPRTGIPTPITPQTGPRSAPGSTSGGASVQGTATRRPINPFLANDPNQKARRLARALVSDMVAYHPSRREEGLRDGTLKQVFREEIKKSYEEYVEQVGREFAESTSHFQDALNDVLAGGRKIF